MIRALIVAVSLCCTTAIAKDTLVKNVAEFDAAVKDADSGDEIVLANGEWRDAELVFRASDRQKRPITMRAETPGRVVLTGKSRLRIGGRCLIVRDLLWKDSTAESEIVAFRIDSKTLAADCALLECAIIGDAPDKERKWVSIYGSNNGVSNCRFEGKQSPGTLLVVWLSDQSHGRAMIVDTFFGPRTRLGKNGGEIIRIGDSKTSHVRSEVEVSGNYFYRCDGEAEIISNKSCENSYSLNTFVGCSGALTFRHGNQCEAVDNAFFGDGRKGTGGVRVIGENHRVASNLFHELTGDDTRAAVSLMNGIPDSPLNGYFQVKKAKVEGNTFIRCKESIVVGLSDEDQKNQTLPPVDCSITENAVLSPGRPVFVIHQEPQGTRHERNVYVGETLGMATGTGWRQYPSAPQFDLASGTTLRSKDGEFDVDKFELQTKPSYVGPAWMCPGDEYLPEVLKKK